MRKHSELIKAWADNNKLVIFVRVCENDAWTLAKEPVQWEDGNEYFASLPQHKEACLHWLNGGDIQYQDFPTNKWITLINSTPPCFSMDSIFICDECNIRPKPRKGKRWIGIANDGYVTPLQETKHLAECYAAGLMHGEFKYQEIEVEV